MLSKALLFAAFIAVACAQSYLVRILTSSMSDCPSTSTGAKANANVYIFAVGQCIALPSSNVFHYYSSWMISALNSTHMTSTYYNNYGCTSPSYSYNNIVEPLRNCYAPSSTYVTDFMVTSTIGIAMPAPYIQIQNYSTAGCAINLAQVSFQTTYFGQCSNFDNSGGDYHVSGVTSSGLQTGCASPYSCSSCTNTISSGSCTTGTQNYVGSSRITIVGVSGTTTVTSNSAGTTPSTNPTTQFSGSGTGAPVGGNSNTGGSSYQGDTITPQPDGTLAHPSNKAKYNATGAATLSRGEGSPIIALLVAAFGIFAAVVMF